MELKSRLIFRSVDQIAARLEIAETGKVRLPKGEVVPLLRSNRILTFHRSILPPDFEPEKYDVEGEITVKITAKRKKVKKVDD